MNALLLGQMPGCDLGYTYVTAMPYEAVVIGSLTIGQMLCFSQEAVLQALAQNMPVVLYEPGLPTAKANRGLSAALASRRRELKNWGVVFTSGAERRVITAQQAQLMRQKGEKPAAGAVLTPLAKEILES